MGLSFYPINISLTTNSADYDILQNTIVKDRLKERYGWNEVRYQEEVQKGIRGLYFDIYCENTQVKINDGNYQALIANAVYSTDDYLNYGIKSIKIKDTAINITLSIKML